MKTMGFRVSILAVVLVTIAGAASAGAEDLRADMVKWGKELFAAQCASCHGTDGKGEGPAAEALKKPPTDLTKIAARNDGKFPRVTVEEIIDGQRRLLAHGNREMPVWGEVFTEKAGVYPAAMRVSALVDYLESIQVTEAKPAK